MGLQFHAAIYTGATSKAKPPPVRVEAWSVLGTKKDQYGQLLIFGSGGASSTTLAPHSNR